MLRVTLRNFPRGVFERKAYSSYGEHNIHPYDLSLSYLRKVEHPGKRNKYNSNDRQRKKMSIIAREAYRTATGK